MTARLIKFPAKTSRSAPARREPLKAVQLDGLAAAVKSFAEQASFLAAKAAAVVRATEASRSALKKLTD